MKAIGLDMRMAGKQNGGIGRYAFEIAGQVLKQDLENSYTLFFNQNNIQASEIDYFKKFNRVKIVIANIRHYSFREQLQFNKILEKENLDLVHFPNFNVPAFYKKPFVVTIHDMVHHKISGHKKSRYLQFLAYKKIIEKAAINSKKIITVSNYSKKDIASYLQVPLQKIKVIYEGSNLNTDVTAETAKEVRQKFYLDKPYFLFVGILERKKNLINLTRGFDYFLKKYKKNMDLVVVGKVDKHYPEIKFKAMDIKHKDNLVFADFVEDADLAALYKETFAFVSASLHEGFGLPGVEAMKFGIPLAVSNIEVFNEIYDNSAIYFNPLDPEDIADKLNLLVKDQQFYEQQQMHSWNQGQLYSWEKAGQETLEVYKEILSEQKVL